MNLPPPATPATPLFDPRTLAQVTTGMIARAWSVIRAGRPFAIVLGPGHGMAEALAAGLDEPLTKLARLREAGEVVRASAVLDGVSPTVAVSHESYVALCAALDAASRESS